MDEARALSIVSTLANGVNPVTGEIFPSDSPYQTPDVVRALFVVTRLLEARTRTRPRSSQPGNAGKPWNADEDQKLLRDFDRGTSIADLAQSHGRTPAGIQARLEKHGRLAASTAAEGAGARARWRSTAPASANR
jgi:hypothetical protein